MRGNDQQQDGVFSYVSLEQRVPASHPLRAIRKLVDEALGELSPRFEELYASTADRRLRRRSCCARCCCRRCMANAASGC